MFLFPGIIGPVVGPVVGAVVGGIVVIILVAAIGCFAGYMVKSKK